MFSTSSSSCCCVRALVPSSQHKAKTAHASKRPHPVPLKERCSTKCATPLLDAFSYTEPVSIHTPTHAVCPGICRHCAAVSSTPHGQVVWTNLLRSDTNAVRGGGELRLRCVQQVLRVGAANKVESAQPKQRTAAMLVVLSSMLVTCTIDSAARERS
jgi:hypothetical protein